MTGSPTPRPRAVILAAGRGSRMGSATTDCPKGMVHLHGRPLIAWQLEALARAGVDDIAIVRGYRGESLPFDVTYFENDRWSETSIVTSLAAAEPWLTAGPTIVTYADIVYAPSGLPPLLEAAGDVVIAYDPNWLDLWQRRFDDPLSDAETFRVDEDGLLQEIGQRPECLADVQGQYMGLVKLTPAGAGRLLDRFRSLGDEARDRLDVTALLDLALRDGEAIRAVPFEGRWCEVDHPTDLSVAEQIAAQIIEP